MPLPPDLISKLIHPGQLEEGVFLERSRSHDFPAPWILEMMAWNYEIYAQVQKVVEGQCILRGGAAAQLHMAIEEQRASIDVDTLTSLGFGEVDDVVTSIRDSLGISFELHTPAKGQERDLPLKTYWVHPPFQIKQPVPAGKKYEEHKPLKLEFLCLGKTDIHSDVLRNPKSFAIDLAFSPACLTPGALFADKCLTFAEGTVGIAPEKQDELHKQLYDLYRIAFAHMGQEFFEDVCRTLNILGPLEEKFYGIHAGLSDILQGVNRKLSEFETPDLREGNSFFRDTLNNFQSTFLTRKQRRKFYNLATEALFVRFLIAQVRDAIGNPHEGWRRVEKVWKLFNGLREESAEHPNVREKLLAATKDLKISYWKELKNRPWDRIFWLLAAEGYQQ